MSHSTPKILIIRYSSIGDVVLTSPIIRCVHEQLGAEVHYLTKASMAQLVQDSPYISKVYSIKEDNKEVIGHLLQEHYDAIIDLHKNLRSRQIVRRLNVVTYSYDKLNIRKWLYVNLKINRLPDKHLVDRYFDGVRTLGVSNDGKGLDHYIPEADAAFGRQYHRQHGPYKVAVLGANYYTKRIPVQLLQKMINTDLNTTYILVGGADVTADGDRLARATTSINMCGKLTLGQSAAIISMADHVISGDTGMMHIAAAYQRPMTSIWGSTVPALGMYPYYGDSDVPRHMAEVEGLGCRPCSKLGYKRCPRGHFRCMMDQQVTSHL